ncbi:MAG: hypothetical protein DRJ44_07705, partial [Thermoprotei archaeon]
MITISKISIVIPSYNSHSTIKKCIESLLKQKTNIDYEIIVVDSSDDKGVVEILGSFLGIKLIRSRKRLNAGQARNIGVRASQGDIIAFIDSDCIAPENWLEKIILTFKEHPEICGVFGVYTGGRTLLEKISGGEFLEKSSTGFFQGFIEGNCAFKREVFEKGCLWSERTRSQYVQLAECIRSNIKKPVRWNPKLKVLHLGRVTWKKIVKSGISKFEEDMKNSILLARSLTLTFGLIVGCLLFLYSLFTMNFKYLLLSALPNIPLVYYTFKGCMLSPKYK